MTSKWVGCGTTNDRPNPVFREGEQWSKIDKNVTIAGDNMQREGYEVKHRQDDFRLGQIATARSRIMRDEDVGFTGGENVVGKDQRGLEWTKERQMCMILFLKTFPGGSS